MYYEEPEEYQLEWEKTDTNAKVTQMLEYLDKDYKATIIIMLQWLFVNILWTNKKIVSTTTAKKKF